MKGLKSKLMAATAMLTVSAVMLVSTSFAWYTLSTNPEISNIKATAVANENLEIALDKNYESGAKVDEVSNNTEVGAPQGSTTNKYETWGNYVDVANVLTGAELRPAAYTANSGLYTATYGNDGRVSGKVDLTVPARSTGAEILTRGNDENATKYAFKVDYWLRTNKAGTIALSTAADNANKSGLTKKGAGSTITVNGNSSFESTDFGIVFKVTEDGKGTPKWVQATIANGVITADDIIDAKANVAYLVEMYVYLDGTKVTNADAATATDADGVVINVQFKNSAITADGTGAMKY